MAGPDDGTRGFTTVDEASSGAGDRPSQNQTSDAPSPSTYPLAGRSITRCGHVIEYNDTPSGERIRFLHQNGISEIDMKSDGSVNISSAGKMIMTIGHDMTITVHGNMNYDVQGDINMNATGAINMNCTDVNITTAGDMKQNVGSLRTTARGNVGLVAENVSETILGSRTATILGSNSQLVDGTNRIVSEGSMQIASGENIKVSAEGDYDMSSNSANMAANSMTVIGATGTMGGDDIYAYFKNARIKTTLYADISVDTPQGNITRLDGTSAHYTTFHGDLNGTAAEALAANVAAAPGGGGASLTSSTADQLSNDTTGSARPTSGLLSEYLNVSSKGIAKVEIDETEIRNMYRRSVYNGGYSNRELTTNDLRQACRDGQNLSNTDLINNHIAQGTISAAAVTPMPTGIGRTSSAGVPDQFYGAGATDDDTQPYYTVPGVPSKRRFIPPQGYYITNSARIDAGTELLPGIRLSTFLRYASQTIS